MNRLLYSGVRSFAGLELRRERSECGSVSGVCELCTVLFVYMRLRTQPYGFSPFFGVWKCVPHSTECTSVSKSLNRVVFLTDDCELIEQECVRHFKRVV